jgi:hypothetical protein
MPDEPIDKDIDDVMAEERSRGRRPLDLKAKKERAELLRHIREALESETEREFLEAIRGLQLAEEPEKLDQAVKIWRSYSSSGRKRRK